jgi:hypothetical protein
MPNKTTGVLLRSESGHRYFIPHTQLDGYKVEEAEVNHNDVNERAPRMEAWSAQRTGDNAPVVAMMTS